MQIKINENKNQRLDIFLNEMYPDYSRAFIQNKIRNKEITLFRNLKQINKPGELIKSGDIIDINFEEPKEISAKPEQVEFEIVYQDSDIAVINKPQGVVVHPCSTCLSGTLVNGLLNKIKDLSGINGALRPGIVHRIDKNTCGLLIIAKNDFAHINLAKQISEKTCARKYLALVQGTIKPDIGIVETKLARDKKDRKKMKAYDMNENIANAKIAITEYKTIEFFKDFSLVEFSLKTGRTHQIRAHAKFLNHPIVGDETYGGLKKFGLIGQFLCAYQIKFIHPRTKKEMKFQIELPEKFLKILQNLKK